MSKHYTVLVIDDKGSRVREALISKRMVWLFTATVSLFLSIIAGGALHYTRLNHMVNQKALLEAKLEQEQASVEHQRKQIQSFAKNINELKSSLLELNDFENKIRIMANLEHKGDQASLFSVGGSVPEDLDPSIPLEEEHDRLMRQMHTEIRQVNQASAVQKTSFETLLTSLKDKRNVLAATPSLRPASGWISSDFGYRISPFTNRREFHRGLDIANREGTPIIATADGLVTFAENKWLIGNMVSIDHGYGISTIYGHLSKLLKKKGDRVKRGETIALMGTTGRSTGPHLHYEVRLNGVQTNPKHYILD